MFRSGFVGLVGPTNSGKSTLVNALVGQKVSIVSGKPQTTLRTVRGIVTNDEFQLIFVDTPGLNEKFGEPWIQKLNQLADTHAQGCDQLLWVFDATHKNIVAEISRMAKVIGKWKPKGQSLCILNKVDKVAKPDLLPILQSIFDLDLFDEIIPISALKKDGVDRVLKILGGRLPEGDLLYDGDWVTDRGPDFRVAELVREKIYQTTRQELPYSVWISVEPWEKGEGKKTPIQATIHVESDSKKGILIGKKGTALKEIGTRARKEIEEVLGYPVFLQLHVRVHSKWRKDPVHVDRYLEMPV